MYVKLALTALLASHLGSAATLQDRRDFNNYKYFAPTRALAARATGTNPASGLPITTPEHHGGLKAGFIGQDKPKSHGSKEKHAGGHHTTAAYGKHHSREHQHSPAGHQHPGHGQGHQHTGHGEGHQHKSHGQGHEHQGHGQGHKHQGHGEGHKHQEHGQGSKHHEHTQRSTGSGTSPSNYSPESTNNPSSSTESQPKSTSPSNSPSGQSSYTGDITYYTPGLGSCGVTNTESDMIVALAEDMMTAAGGANPNDNPYCGRSITITHGGVTATAKIEDTCPGCSGAGLDLTPSLFEKFADLSVGRVSGVQWSFN